MDTPPREDRIFPGQQHAQAATVNISVLMSQGWGDGQVRAGAPE